MSADLATHLSHALEGRYDVGSRLGEGATATVYLAKDLRHSRSVAIKVLLPDLAAAVGPKRFLAEIRTTASLQHPHIVPLFDSGQTGDYLFYVMPYVAGRTLKERLEAEPRVSLDEAIEIVTKIAEALDYAHRQGVLHRDIKPGNILLSPGGPMLSDFGIARALGERASADSLKGLHNSGTPQYMSLEQLAGDVSLDARSDLYSLACVFFEMLAGEPPQRASTPFALLRKRIEESPLRISHLRPDVPDHIADVLARALERDREGRLDSVIEFARELRKGTAQLVLFPIANASLLDEHDWFCDALSVEIRHRLSAVQGLKVVQADAAHEQGSGAPLLQLVRQLRGSHALIGSAGFHDGFYTISIQLIRASDGTHLWSHRFDGKLTSQSRFTVQDQIASEVVHRLPGGLRLRALSARRPSPRAEPLFWEAQSAWQSRSTDKLLAAESLFRMAIETDPGFARAWVGLARVYVVLGGPDYATRPPSDLYPRARVAADRALELDPDLWEAHAVLGNCAMSYDWDWEAAEDHFREAIDRNASYSSALQWYSNFMMYRGRRDEAFELANRALATSDSKYLRSSLARHHAVVGQLSTAIEKFQEALEMDHGFRSALIGLAFARLQAGDVDAFLRDVEAMATSVGSSSPPHRQPLLEAMRAHGLGRLGRSDEAFGIIGWLESAASERRAPSGPYVPPEFVALAYLGDGDNARALDWLERAAEVRSHVMPSLMVEPVLATLRAEPRFVRLLERIHGPLGRLGARGTPSPAGTAPSQHQGDAL